MTPWTRGLVFCTLPDAFTCSQEFRSFCTAMCIILPGHKAKTFLHPDVEHHACTKNYTWRGEGRSKDTLPLYRSRSAYYDILRVTPNATQSQIKTAYYKQSFIYHPDKNPGNKEATQVFSEVSEAYIVLGNIALRRKYDRGILSETDVQGAGKPSYKESTSSSTGSSPQQQRSRQFTQRGGKPIYDFDAFYRAHYGEQLQREQELRVKQRMREMQKQNIKKWQRKKIFEILVTMLCASAGLILYNIKSP